MPSKKKEKNSPVKLKCRLCVYNTKNRSDLRRHERRHEDVKFPCEICNMPFMTAGHLSGHKRSAHNVQSERVTSKSMFRQVCHECDYTTIYSSDMSRHRRKHEVNQHPCPICNYPFGHITTLTIHIRKYHGENKTTDLTEGSLKENSYKIKKKGSQTRRQTNNPREGVSFKRRIGGSNKTLENRETLTKRSTFPREIEERKSVQSGDEINSDFKIPQCVQDREIVQTEKAISPKLQVKLVAEHTGKVCKSEYDLKSQKTFENKQSPSPNRNLLNSNETYACKHCIFSTRDIDAFHRHNKRHDKGKFKCSECGKPFLFKTSLDKHLKTKHTDLSESSDSSFETSAVNSPTVLKCAQCKFVTFSYNQLESHVENHRNLAGKTETKSKPDSKMEPRRVFNVDEANARSDKSIERCDKMIRDHHIQEEGNDRVPNKEPSDGAKSASTSKDLIKYIEEYHCKECNYVTSDKKFIKLHMTMHGSDYIAPRNGTNRKRHSSAKNAGYEIRLKPFSDEPYTISSGASYQKGSCNTKAGDKRPTDKTFNKFQKPGEYSTTDEKEVNIAVLDKEYEEENQHKTNKEEIQENGDLKEPLSKTGSGDSISTGSHDANAMTDLIGGLTRDDFKRTKKFYTTERVNNRVLYTCKLCVIDGKFNSQNEIYCHFKLKHQALRDKICTSCKYCNGPFPVTD